MWIFTLFQIDWSDNGGDYSKNTITPEEGRGGCIKDVVNVLALGNWMSSIFASNK
jgi:hypothetical protein